MKLPSWGIVTTADAPAPLILCHAAHHLAAGASEVHVYLDAPRQAAASGVVGLLQSLPGCRVTLTDRAYWRQRSNGRPRLHQIRQTRNATAALESCGVDHLLHLDVDEYLWQWEPLAEELALLPPGAFLRIGNVERIFGAGPARDVFTRTFRVPETLFPQDEDRRPVDPGGLTEWGLTGHAEGKAVSPRGYGYTVGIHRPRLPRDGAPRYPGHRLSEAATILHFDGFTRRDWVFKLLRKGEALEAHPKVPVSELRLRQVAALMTEGNDLRAAEELHDRLKCLTPEREAALRESGRVIDIPFDPMPPLARHFPDQDFDLSAAAHDQWLAETKRATFARFGLEV